MKQVFQYILIFIIGVAVGYFYLTKKPDTKVITEVVPGDSVFTVKVDTQFRYITEYEYVYDSLIDTVFKYNPVDTQKILRAYFTPKMYTDTIQDDTSMTVIIIDSINRNRLLSRKSKLKNNREVSITNITTYNQNGIYVGGEVSLNHLQLSASYLHNKNNFEIGLNFINLENQSKIVPSIGYKRLIWSKHGNN